MMQENAGASVPRVRRAFNDGDINYTDSVAPGDASTPLRAPLLTPTLPDTPSGGVTYGGTTTYTPIFAEPEPQPYKAGTWTDYFQVDLLPRVKPVDRFAVAFTLFCCATFMVPIFLMLSIGEDQEVKFWITDKLWMVLSLPVLYLIAYIVHVRSGGPIRFLVLLCTVGSSIGLMIVAEVVLQQANRVADSLTLVDCIDGATQSQSGTWIPDINAAAVKRQLGDQWKAALKFYSGCIQNTVKNDPRVPSEEMAVKIYRIQECSGYFEQLAVEGTHWKYLQAVEDRYRCAGWCGKGPPMWSLMPVKDTCSASVAALMRNKIARAMDQIIVYSFLSLALVSTILVTLGTDARRLKPLFFGGSSSYW
jgi:hypothetical protein